MKRILISLAIIVAVGAIVVGGTSAFFSDSETSAGNVFTAGSIDLKIDHLKASYNGEECVTGCQETGYNLIANGGFEEPDIPYGTWDIYPESDFYLTSWHVESGDGLEIQDHAAGDPHTGGQLAELDSNNSSVIYQVINTVPGGEYNFKFWYSPRPNVPAGDNTIGAIVQIVSDSTILLSDTIGADSAGSSETVWTLHEYNFIATEETTIIKFADAGAINNSYGGYLDDISVMALDCSDYEYEYGGTCTLWNAKDLGDGDTFFNFTDIKPGDYGINVISLHPQSNDAWACLSTFNEKDLDNTLAEPEVEMGDDLDIGELSPYLQVFAWWDNNANGAYDTGDTYIAPITNFDALGTLALADSNTGSALPGGQTKNLGLSWCAGFMATPVIDTPFVCDGSGMGNITQTDSYTTDILFYAEQQRNNDGFICLPPMPPIMPPMPPVQLVYVDQV